MASSPRQFLIELYQEHLEEASSLFEQRQDAIKDPDYTLPELIELEERIAAHIDGLVLGREKAMAVCQEGLSSGETSTTLAAAYALLNMDHRDAADLVWQAFQEAENGPLQGLCMAMSYGRIDMILAQLQEALASAAAPVAVAAAEALACHEKPGPTVPRLGEFLQNEDALVRGAAWRLIMLNASSLLPGPEMSARLSAAVTNDEDPAVREQALYAAAWTRQPWLLEHCRQMADEPTVDNWDAVLLLAVLGKPTDLNRILAVAGATELGPRRFHALGAFGHPQVVELLLENMKSEDPLTAVAAGAAFKKISGTDIESDRRVQIPPADGSEPDEFEQEFLDEVTLPDPEAAQTHWQKVREEFTSGMRWCNGRSLTEPAGEEVLGQLDLESRWEACLRGRFEGTSLRSLADLEVFPQKPM